MFGLLLSWIGGYSTAVASCRSVHTRWKRIAGGGTTPPTLQALSVLFCPFQPVHKQQEVRPMLPPACLEEVASCHRHAWER